MASAKSELVVDLSCDHVRWLEGATAEYELPDTGKAFRCALMFAMSRGPLALPSPGTPAEGTAPFTARLAPQQLAWLGEEVRRAGEGATASQVATAMCNACAQGHSDDVFGVVRCKTGVATADSACEGARAALAKQRARAS
ncbi:hypothetical protein KFE25_013676 [Diacronema lutheri]|uniref:Uncharacterized protein n=2 Tax=Diacronema lutheri TaxID=2081491 RepID=A0A8J6CIA6_DIALT|nr:hypothetical protein KFE25_013676 [Diacronema lutheri]